MNINQKWVIENEKTGEKVFGFVPSAMVKRLFGTYKNVEIEPRITHGSKNKVYYDGRIIGLVMCKHYNGIGYPIPKRKEKFDYTIPQETKSEKIATDKDNIDMIQDIAFRRGILKAQADFALQLIEIDNGPETPIEKLGMIWEFVESYK